MPRARPAPPAPPRLQPCSGSGVPSAPTCFRAPRPAPGAGQAGEPRDRPSLRPSAWRPEVAPLAAPGGTCARPAPWPSRARRRFASGTNPFTSLLCESSISPICCTGAGEGPGRRKEMRTVSGLLAGCLFMLAVTEAECISHPGCTSPHPGLLVCRRHVCSATVEGRMVSFLVSHAHPVYQPYLTACQGQRLCSTYSTIYRVSYRQAYRTLSPPMHRCCPGWRRASGHAWQGCNTAICQPPCQNGGKCSLPNKCACPVGWAGRHCQTDVDECAGGRHGCSQACVNMAGSYSCSCQKGHKLQADRKTCQAPEVPTDAPGLASPAGAPNWTVQQNMTELRARVVALEEKLQLALAPFLSLELLGPESSGGGSSNTLGLLLHVWRQVDRIDSLSEQISFLEEQLERCTCQPGHVD